MRRHLRPVQHSGAEHQQRQHQHARLRAPDQRSPCVRPQRYGVEEPGDPIGDDHPAVVPPPRTPGRRHRACAEDADDLVVPAHDGPDDVARLLRAPERGLPATPDHRQPVARQDQFRADRDASEEAVEVGQAHAVFGRVVRHQERVQGIEIDGAGLGDRVGHGGAGPWRWRKVARAHGRRARKRRIVGERACDANRPPAPTPVHRRPPPHGGGPASRDARPSSGVPCQRSNAGRCGCRGPLSPWRRATPPAPPPRAHRLRRWSRHRPASRPS